MIEIEYDYVGSELQKDWNYSESDSLYEFLQDLDCEYRRNDSKGNLTLRFQSEDQLLKFTMKYL